MIGIRASQSRTVVAATAIASFFLTILPPLPAFAAQTTADSLAGYWKLDETSGTSAADASGSGNAGTHQSSPVISSTVPTLSYSNSRSLQFSGSPTKNYVSTSLTRPTSGTISLWAYPTSYTDWVSPAGWKLLGANNGYTLIDVGGAGSPGKWRAVYRPNNSGNAEAAISAAGSVSQNAWSHLAMTWSVVGTTHTVALYVNGVQEGTTTWTGTPGSSGLGNFNFGKSGDYDDNYFVGNVDDVRVYSRALAPWEVSQLSAGNHVQAFWKGTAGTGFEQARNWSGAYVPDPYARLVQRVATGSLTLTGAIKFAGLTINTGALLSLNGTGVTMNDAGTFTNYGTLALKNSETLTNLTGDAARGTVMLVGTGTTTGLKMGNSYNNLTVNDGLLAYWNFESAAGTRVPDESGYNNSGSLIGGATLSSTVPPTNFRNTQALALNGTSGYLNGADFQTGDNITVAYWMNPSTTANSQAMVGKHMSDGDNIFLLGIYNNGYQARIRSVTYQAGTVTTGWQHLAYTFQKNGSSTNVTFYKNGHVVWTQTLASTIGNTAGLPWEVGQDWDSGPTASDFFGGSMDEVRIYNRVLNGGEIAALAVGNQPSTARGTVTLNAALDVNGDLTLNGGTLDVSSSNHAVTLGRSLLNNGGILNARKGTLTVDGSSSALKLLSGGARLNALTLNGAGTWTLQDRLTVSGALTLTNGTLDANAAASYTLSAGSFTQTSGSFEPRSGKVILTDGSDSALRSPSLYTLRIEDPTENGLIAYWKFDEGTNSGSIVDSTGNRRTAVRVGGGGKIWSGSVVPSVVRFDNPYSMQFDGTDDYVNAGTSITWGANAAKSVSMWMKTPVAGDTLIQQAGSAIYLYLPMSGVLQSWMGNSDYTFGALSLTDNAWHHIAWTYDGTAETAYVDGVQVGTPNVEAAPADSGVLYVGRADFGEYWTGHIDDVRVYNRALTAREAANLARGRYAGGGAATATVTLGGNLEVENLAIDSGTLDTDAHDLDVSGPLVLEGGDGNLTLGSGDTTLGGLILSGSTVTGGAGDLHITWDLQQSTGSFIAPSGTTTIDGNLLHMGGEFDANDGTVVLGGTNQTVDGSTEFHNLTKVATTDDTLYFGAGGTYTISGSLVLQGSGGGTLSLESTDEGETWALDATGTQTISNVDLRDVVNESDGPITCLSACTFSGESENWDIPGWSLNPEEIPQEQAPAASNGGGGGGGGGGRRGTQANMATRIAAVRESIVSRFQRQVVRGEPPAPETASPSAVARGSASSVVVRAAAPARKLESIAQRRGLLVATVASKSVVYEDVPVDAWFAPYVASLIDEGIAQGYKTAEGEPIGKFGVADPITYAEALKMAMESVRADLRASDPVPRNASAKGTWAAPYVALAEKKNIAALSADRNVHAPVTRAETVAIILQILDLPVAPQPPTFADVPAIHPYAKAIATAAFYGIIQGDTAPDGTNRNTFRPDATINRAEVAKIIALLQEVLE